MADKNQFTFDDDDFPTTEPGPRKASPEPDLNDDDFAETDLSAAFAEGEHSAEMPAPAVKAKGGGHSRSRILLLILLLVVIVGAGAYYFMDLGGTTPSVPTVSAPAQTTAKTVALPPQPPTTPAQPPAESAAKPVTVAVPPPPPAAAAAAAGEAPPAATELPATQVTQPAEPMVAPPAGTLPASQPAPRGSSPAATDDPAATSAAETVSKAPAGQQAQAQPVPVPPTAASPPVAAAVAKSAPAKPVPGGTYMLDAGSYLLEGNRDVLVAQIRKLGFEPLITPVDATLQMTRLRLGTFDQDEVAKALLFAQSIEPGSYSVPAGDRFVIYAGTFLQPESVARLSQRFLAEGIKVHPEPVQVVRTLSRIRFGSYMTEETAAAAAREVGLAGLQVAVVKSR